MTWVVLAIAVGFWLLARVERAAASKIRAEINDAHARLDRAVENASELRVVARSAERTRLIVLPAPFPLAASATTDCQAACALYSWLTIRGEGRA